ncbi:hypothetical protein [Pseudoroseomonas aestuarii]
MRSILGDIQRGINASVMLTEEAVKRVATGRERTDTTQSTITEITGRIQESVQTFQQIVASTNQQQLGIEQVMSALQNIRRPASRPRPARGSWTRRRRTCRSCRSSSSPWPTATGSERGLAMRLPSAGERRGRAGHRPPSPRLRGGAA